MTDDRTLVRIEYLDHTGWVSPLGHEGILLISPQGYVDRLRANDKFGRAFELDADGNETGKVWAPDDCPDPRVLVPSQTRVPRLPPPPRLCRLCDEPHPPPHDGTCLL